MNPLFLVLAASAFGNGHSVAFERPHADSVLVQSLARFLSENGRSSQLKEMAAAKDCHVADARRVGAGCSGYVYSSVYFDQRRHDLEDGVTRRANILEGSRFYTVRNDLRFRAGADRSADDEIVSPDHVKAAAPVALARFIARQRDAVRDDPGEGDKVEQLAEVFAARLSHDRLQRIAQILPRYGECMYMNSRGISMPGRLLYFESCDGRGDSTKYIDQVRFNPVADRPLLMGSRFAMMFGQPIFQPAIPADAATAEAVLTSPAKVTLADAQAALARAAEISLQRRAGGM